ncbi:MAG: NADH-quinone oxidoreductase subunit J [Planctomycetota bacterium]
MEGLEGLAFFVLAAMAVYGALNVVLRRNPVACALFLVTTFVALAGLFVLLGSGFLAAIQVLVYAGAIMVLFLFVIMLLNLEKDLFKGISPLRFISGLLAVILGASLVWGLVQPALPPPAEKAMAAEGVDVGQILFERYLFPFEAVSFLLLAAMIGVIVIAKRRAPVTEVKR